MMKKNLLNKHVVKAISLGLSAVMLTTPMQAMAAEGEDVPDTDDNNITQNIQTESSVCDDAQDAASEVDTAVDTAKGSEAVAVNDVNGNVTAGEVVDSKGKDLAQAVIDEANGKEAALEDVDTAIDNVDTQLDVAETNDGLAKGEVDKAASAVDKAEQIADEADAAMDAAQNDVNTQIENIKNSSTIDEANAAYDAAEDRVTQAQEDFDAKLADYNQAKADYKAAAAKAAEKKAAYDEAVKAADDNAEAAAEILEKAQEEAERLKQAVEAAKNAVANASKTAMDIAEKEELTQTDGGRNWRNEDKLFISIMENYYLPEVLEIEGAKVTRVQGKDNNEYNYFKAEYTDADGNPQVKYYNFKMDVNEKGKPNSHNDNIVIFEKREVEIFGDPNETPDRYKDAQGNIKNIAEGLEDGSLVAIVDSEGKTTYYEKNEVTDSETLVEDSEITGTSKTDVIVDETTEKETYKIDENGNLVKEVTADVTTITYTDATFTSDEEYASAEERDAAAELKKGELEEETGKDATIEETEKTTYVATGTYIPTFTKTVEIKNKEVEKGNRIWDDASTEKEAVSFVKNGVVNDYKEDDEYYFIGAEDNLKVTGSTKATFGDDADYLVSGNVTVTYAKVTKKTVDQSTLGAIWDDIKALFGSGKSANEKLTEVAKNAIEATGGILVSANWDDWRLGKATIRYVAGVAVENVEEKDSAEAAQVATSTAALAQAKVNGATGVYNVKVAKAEGKTSYSYKVNYLEKASENKVETVIATESYADAETLTGEIIQNLNYIHDIILLDQNNKDYRNFVDAAKNMNAKYERLLKEAAQAQADVVAARDAVTSLRTEIDNLKKAGPDLNALEDLATRLSKAESKLEEAEDKRDALQKQLKEAADILGDVIDALTPDVAPGGGGTGETGGDDTTVLTPVATTQTPQQVVQTLAANAGAGAGTAQAVVAINDEATPLAGGIRNERTEEVDEADEAIVAIEDEDTPLAATLPSAEEKANMSWWWLLIIAILGTTGYALYKKSQKKKEEVPEA